MVIDDFLPTLYGAKEPYFGKARQSNGKNILWVCLIEKAWAKICGNYDRSTKGTVQMGFIHLCGVPSVGFSHKEHKMNKLWEHL